MGRLERWQIITLNESISCANLTTVPRLSAELANHSGCEVSKEKKEKQWRRRQQKQHEEQ